MSDPDLRVIFSLLLIMLFPLWQLSPITHLNPAHTVLFLKPFFKPTLPSAGREVDHSIGLTVSPEGKCFDVTLKKAVTSSIFAYSSVYLSL